MSHNNKSYRRQIRKRDYEGSMKITDLFRPPKPTSADDNLEPDSSLEPDASDGGNTKVNVEPLDDSSTYRFIKRSDSYEKSFKWLYYSVNNKGYMCKVCEQFGDKVNIFTKGADLGDHPTRVLDSHANSKVHINALEVQAARCRPNIVALLNNEGEKIRNTNREVLKKLFASANFLIKKKWALSENFESFIRFLGHVGVDELADHMKSPSHVTYMSSKSVTEFIDILSEYYEQTLLSSLRAAEFFTLLADESTDEASREQMSIFARWEHQNGLFNTHFLGIINLKKTDSETLLNEIKTFFVAKGIDIRNVRFMGFDGANVMSGKEKGLQRRITHESPHSIYINCRNHRLALCLKHIMKKPKYSILVEVDATLLSLYNLFKYSPKKFSVFTSVQEAYAERSLKLIRAATTRWLSHGKACERVTDRYSEIVDTLDAIYDDTKDPQVMGIRIAFLERKFVAMVYLLVDVLRVVNQLSLFLQQEELNYTDLPHRVSVSTSRLKTLIDELNNRGQHPELTFNNVDDAFKLINDRTPFQRQMRGRQTDMMTPETFLESDGIPFIHELVSEIEAAFHSSESVLASFGVLDPRNLPDTLEELADYGKEDIERLGEFYGTEKVDVYMGHTEINPPDLDQQALKVEFQAIKTHIFVERTRFMDHDNPASQTVLSKFGTKGMLERIQKDGALSHLYPNVTKLYKLEQLIPSSTAIVERGFSLMKLLCSPLRNRLTQNSLEGLMRICYEGEMHLDNDVLETLVNNFRDRKSRRLDL